MKTVNDHNNNVVQIVVWSITSNSSKILAATNSNAGERRPFYSEDCPSHKTGQCTRYIVLLDS